MATKNGTFGSQTCGISFGTSAAQMMEGSGRNMKPSSLSQPRSRILWGIWYAVTENIWLRWWYYSVCRQTTSSCSFRWCKNTIVSSLALERTRRALSSQSGGWGHGRTSDFRQRRSSTL